MNDRIKSLVDEGKELAQKRTWVRDGYESVMRRLNEELATVPDMDEDRLDFTIREWVTNPNEYPTEHKVKLSLHFRADAWLELRYGKSYYDVDWKWEGMGCPSIATIREFAAKLPEAMDHFLSEVQKRNGEYEESAILLTDMVKRLRLEETKQSNLDLER